MRMKTFPHSATYGSPGMFRHFITILWVRPSNMKGNSMPKRRSMSVEQALAQSKSIYEAAQRGEVPKPVARRSISLSERLRKWRLANPDKVRASAARAAATRAAKLAAPPGSVCGVCGTPNRVQLDRKRCGVLCPDCGSAVRYAENAERAATYAEAIARYRAEAESRMMS